VAAQALRRIGAAPAPSAEPVGTLTVLLGGDAGDLPGPALSYAEGLLLKAVSPAV
jgi:glutamate racemase